MGNDLETYLTLATRKRALPAELILGLGMHVGQEQIASIAGDPVDLCCHTLQVIDIAQNK
jgi:hypothetical protein